MLIRIIAQNCSYCSCIDIKTLKSIHSFKLTGQFYQAYQKIIQINITFLLLTTFIINLAIENSETCLRKVVLFFKYCFYKRVFFSFTSFQTLMIVSVRNHYDSIETISFYQKILFYSDDPYL